MSRETRWSHRPNKYGRDPYVDKSPQSVACWHLHMLKKSNKNEETRWVEQMEEIDWLQSTRIVTCSCERSRTFPTTRACKKSRQSSSSRSTSCRLAAWQRLQPIQQKFESDDLRVALHVELIRVVRNFTTISTMFSLSSLLEARNCVLQMRTLLDWQRIHKNVDQTKTGCTLLWCSIWQGRRTKRVPYGLECVQEML